jgi:hypothetical protein
MSAVVLIDRLEAARPSPTPRRRVVRAAGLGRPAQAQELLVGLVGPDAALADPHPRQDLIDQQRPSRGPIQLPTGLPRRTYPATV